MLITFISIALMFRSPTPAEAKPEPIVFAQGEWSKPVADNRGYTLRGRLLLAERTMSPERIEVAVYVELQDVGDSIGSTMRVYCDMGKNDFRPEYRGGLECDLYDGKSNLVASSPFPFGGAVPRSEWLSLPTDGTMRVRATPFGIYRPRARAICPHLGKLWIIDDQDPKEYSLSGRFTVEPSAEKTQGIEEHIWRGTIELPALKVKARK